MSIKSQLSILLPGLFLLPILASSCSRLSEQADQVVVSVSDQKLALVKRGKTIKEYKVSTSKYGVGDNLGSYKTPLGKLAVVSKIGKNQPEGMVFKSRRPTGEILKPNSPGRDPIVTRILWLAGKEDSNKNAFSRCIYIHGTPEEHRIGNPASYGCIRMTSEDVSEIFDCIPYGAEVVVTTEPLKSAVKKQEKPNT